MEDALNTFSGVPVCTKITRRVLRFGVGEKSHASGQCHQKNKDFFKVIRAEVFEEVDNQND